MRYTVNCVSTCGGKVWRAFENNHQVGEDFKSAVDAWNFLAIYKKLMR
jgi:hypothetical protein